MPRSLYWCQVPEGICTNLPRTSNFLKHKNASDDSDVEIGVGVAVGASLVERKVGKPGDIAIVLTSTIGA